MLENRSLEIKCLKRKKKHITAFQFTIHKDHKFVIINVAVKIKIAPGIC